VGKQGRAEHWSSERDRAESYVRVGLSPRSLGLLCGTSGSYLEPDRWITFQPTQVGPAHSSDW
jgi:hypothetical protein